MDNCSFLLSTFAGYFNINIGYSGIDMVLTDIVTYSLVL